MAAIGGRSVGRASGVTFPGGGGRRSPTAPRSARRSRGRSPSWSVRCPVSGVPLPGTPCITERTATFSSRRRRSSSVGPESGSRAHARASTSRSRCISAGRRPCPRPCASVHTGHGSSAGHSIGPPTELSDTSGFPGFGCSRVVVPRCAASSGKSASTSSGRGGVVLVMSSTLNTRHLRRLGTPMPPCRSHRSPAARPLPWGSPVGLAPRRDGGWPDVPESPSIGKIDP